MNSASNGYKICRLGEGAQFVPMHWCKAVDSNCSYYQPKMADAENGEIDFLLYLFNCFIYQNIIYERINPHT